jgi:NAD(P)-dependent dehydrogenase (short-subunit alcohol dehydrogenase family)/acyl dehydratase
MIERDWVKGDVVVSRRTFRAGDFNAFAELSGDRNPLHHDPEYAARTAVGTPIVPAALAASPFSAAAGMALPGHRSLVLGIEIRALEPIVYDEEVLYSFRVTTVSSATRTLELRGLAIQRGRGVLEGQLRVRIRDDDAVPDEETETWGTFIPSDYPRRVLVTGAGGSIGGACARALAARDWQVTLQHRSGDPRVTALAEELGARARVEHLAGDLNDVEDLDAMATTLARTPVAAIVHAASPRLDAPAAELHAVNYSALRSLVEAALPGMLERQEGGIVTIGSEAVRTAPPGWDDYVAAKVAAAAFTHTVGRRYRAYGIAATTLHPSYVAGSAFAEYRPKDAVALLPEEVAELVAATIADRESGSPELWIRPGTVERGRGATPNGDPPRVSRREPADEGTTETNSAPAPGSDVTVAREVECVAREVLGLDPAADMTDAALGRTENWTSLAQIEMLLALEQEFGISFSSGDLSGTPSLDDLKALVTEKLP